MGTDIVSELRWWLVYIAIVLFLGIFLYTCWRNRKNSSFNKSASLNASSGRKGRHRQKNISVSLPDSSDDTDVDGFAAAMQPEHGQFKLEEKIVILHVKGPEGRYLNGEDILNIAEREGFTRSGTSETGFFKYEEVIDQGTRQTIFYMANMFHPGTFEWRQMSAFKTHGLSMFARLPSVLLPLEVFDRMLHCAGNIASVLQGTVLDQNHRLLTVDARQDLEKELKDYHIRQSRTGEKR